MTEPTIYVVDRVVVAPGRARDFVDAYRNDYLPGALERGYKLDRITMTPPVFLDDDSNTITASWTVSGAQAWWRSAIAGRYDTAPASWWKGVAPLIVERSRTMEAGVDDIEELCRG